MFFVLMKHAVKKHIVMQSIYPERSKREKAKDGLRNTINELNREILKDISEKSGYYNRFIILL